METEPIEPKTHKNFGFERVMKSSFYSIERLAASFKHEAAFRQEVIMAAILLPASFLLNVPLAQHFLLVGSVVPVLVIELIKSAIEAVVYGISLRNRPFAKRAKNMGARQSF